MRPPKINDRALLKLIDTQKMNQSKAAKELGVSRQAVSKRLQELRGKTTKVVIAKKVAAVVDRKIDAIEQLTKINEYANELLDLLMRWNRGEDEALQILESQVATKKVRVGDQEEFVREFKFKDPRELALKAMAEIRGQLKLQLEIFQALFSLQAAEEFQNIVLDVIAEVDLNVRNEIIRRINAKDQLDRLCDSLNQRFWEIDDAGEPFHKWVKNITLDGRPFTYERHEYLVEPYKDNHPHQVEEKAAQLGLTSKAMLRVAYGARYGGYRGILYLFPSKSDVTDFSKGRIDPLIDENPDTIGKWLRDTDAANIKRIWNAFLYLRGMKSRVGLKSIPVDIAIFDELDEAPQNAIDMAMERMGHSEFKEVLKLSNPTLPDYGIDKAFQETDQRYWLLKCEKCRKYTCLEDTFPECLDELNGSVIRLCQKCRDRELNPSIGEWVAKKPKITDKRGYHYSQLFSHFVEPGDILHQFRTTNNLTDFYNLKIGIAYVEAENRLSVQEVLNLCGNEGIASEDFGPCSMGVDQGKDLHIVIGKRHLHKGGHIIHLGIYKDWEELDRLMRNFNVTRCVVDALPETRNARAFAERFKGKVVLNYYNERQKGHYAWNQKELIVSCNRSESLDASHKEICDPSIILPKECEITKEFARHLHNVAKKLEEDEDTGSKRYIYVKLGPDHFRHAYNYEAMARQSSDRGLFINCDLT